MASWSDRLDRLEEGAGALYIGSLSAALLFGGGAAVIVGGIGISGRFLPIAFTNTSLVQYAFQIQSPEVLALAGLVAVAMSSILTKVHDTWELACKLHDLDGRFADLREVIREEGRRVK